MRGTTIPFLSMSATVLIASAPAASQPPPQPPPELVEGIVHSTVRPPNLDIYLFEKQSVTPRRVTDSAALEYNAVFSPDGRWLVFTSEAAGSADLYALDLEASAAPARLTRYGGHDDAAAFSPDGARLAFVSTRDGNADIFVMPFVPDDPAAGDDAAVNLTRRAGGDFNPAFSPDGERIAYARQDVLWFEDDIATFTVDRTRHTDVYVMSSDGSNPTRLTAPGAMSGGPAWSGDGRFIYYHRLDDRDFSQGGFERGEALGIRRMAADGSGDVAFAHFGLSPAPMPNGRIAYMQPKIEVVYRKLEEGTIVSVSTNGDDRQNATAAGLNCHAPAFDVRSERMACHGPGPVDAIPRRRVDARGDLVFAPPGARRQARLPDRVLVVQGILGQFPALLATGEIVYSLFGGSGRLRPAALEVAALDGGNARTLFALEGAILWGPSVARDAGWIVAAAGPPFGHDERADIWKVRVDGSEATNLTPDSSPNDALPSVSADGRLIAFRSGDAQSRKIHLMSIDGRERRELIAGSGVETMPALSPDGDWVVFSRLIGQAFKLWIQHTDGTAGRLLEPDRADIPDFSMHPRFSPDGQWVVFTSDRGGMNDEYPLTAGVPQPYGDLWAVRVAGGEAVRLTDDKWEDGPGDWGPVWLTD